MEKTESTAPAAPPAVSEAAREQKGRSRLGIVLGVFVVLGVTVGAYRLWTAGDVSTDDAMVDGDVVPVSAMVGGPISAVLVADNAHVHAGDALVQIDTVELKARLQQAEGELAAAQAQADAADAQEQVATASARGGLSTAQAQVVTTRAQVSTAEAQIATAEAQLQRAQTEARRAAADLERGRALMAASGIAQDRLDALQAASDSAAAQVSAAEAQLAAAREGRSAAESRVAEAGGLLDSNAPIDAKIAAAHAGASLAHARVTTASAALDLARLAVTRATVVAPVDGVISKLSVRVGQVLAPGQQVGYLVPELSYVVANFKETQIADIAAGQPVDVEVDTFGGQSFEGVVDSVSAGTGSRFSLLAPDNASGNFVKVVQRVPVRIAWKDAAAANGFKPGQSATVTVHTR